MKNWLPITTRNRVALGFAAVALVIFVSWNFLPFYDEGYTSTNEIAAMTVWPETFSPDNYLNAFKSQDIDSFLEMAAYLSLILNGLIVLAIVPLWRVFHASVFVRLPLAVFNLAGGSVIFWFICRYGNSSDPSTWPFTLILMGLSMYSLSAALFLFKNELELRHQQEVKHTMTGNE